MTEDKSIYIKEMVADWLREHGYDGLMFQDGADSCGCGVDDIMPCIDMVCDMCEAAYAVEEDGETFYYSPDMLPPVHRAIRQNKGEP